MCRRDLKTEGFGGCQLPQAERKDDSAGQLVSSRPSAPSGTAAAFSSSSASELSQLSDSSSKSTGQTNRYGVCFPLDATARFWGQFCLWAPMATTPFLLYPREAGDYVWLTEHLRAQGGRLGQRDILEALPARCWLLSTAGRLDDAAQTACVYQACSARGQSLHPTCHPSPHTQTRHKRFTSISPHGGPSQ